MARISTRDAVMALFAASKKDPRPNEDPRWPTQQARVAVMANGKLEITKKNDPRGKDEGVIGYLNPYQDEIAGVNMLAYQNGPAPISDTTLNKIVAARLKAMGAEVIEDY
jgi:hypothetical protein